MWRPTMNITMPTKVLSCSSALFALLFGVVMIKSQLVPLRYILLGGIVLMVLAIGILSLGFTQTKRPHYVLATVASSMALIVICCIGMKLTTDSVHLLKSISSTTSTHAKDIETTKPFNIYISGIDTYGSIATISRSDVNIVATINPQTRKIVLTTIPRDSYVKIAGGGHDQYDKLTHSGIYGIDASTETVARLLNTTLPNYVRINFTSFIAIVDEIGGIDVANPVAFTTDEHQTFQAGTIHLNGKDALTFSRERHNLAGGDNDRGVNQERVISAIIAKLSSPTILGHYQGIFSVLGSSIQSNITEKSFTSLISQQLDHQKKWQVTMTSVSGTGQTGGLPSYAMPGSQLYMLVIDPNSLQQAQSRIHTALVAK